MSWGSQGNGPDSKSSDPPPRGSVRYFIERIPQERPSWFRHFFREFTGNWDELHEALLDLLRRHEGRLNAQVHIALILLCAGHAGGVEVLLDAIRKPNKPRVYALKELHSIWANERFARGGKPLPMAMQDLVLAMAPLLKDPALPGGKEALEFCLDFALQESLVRTRQLFTHADPEIRCQVAAAFIECGASESALGAASVHWLAPLPGAEESLRAWRRRSQACARPIPRYWQKDATEPMKALRERAAAIATHAVRKTLQMHDAPQEPGIRRITLPAKATSSTCSKSSLTPTRRRATRCSSR